MTESLVIQLYLSDCHSANSTTSPHLFDFS